MRLASRKDCAMRVAQVPPLYEAVPPRFYGGTERVVSHLTDALVELGHDVTLFASAEARTKATLVTVRDQAIRLDPAPLKSDLAAHMSMLSEVRRRADEFDVIHFHTDMIHFPFFEDMAGKTITTLHGRLDLKDLRGVYDRWPQYPLVSISDDQRRPLASASWAGTVHHGMATEIYEFHAQSKGYLAFLGRISPEKRPDRAIAIAKRLGRKLKIAAKVDPADQRLVRLVHPVPRQLTGNGPVDFHAQDVACLHPRPRQPHRVGRQDLLRKRHRSTRRSLHRHDHHRRGIRLPRCCWLRKCERED